MADRKENGAKVLDALKSGIASRGDLRTQTGLHYSDINDALYELEVSGKVEKVETTLKTYYRLAGSQEQPPSPGAPPAAEAAPKPPARTSSAPRQTASKRSAKKGARKGATKAGRTRRKSVESAASKPSAAASVAPPPFSQNGFAKAVRAAAVEFEYQALWGEPSPKADAVRAMVAEAAAHMKA